MERQACNMEKRISQKTILAISAAVVALIVIVSGVLIWKNQHQSYRSIKIVEMDGTVTIDREGISGLNASVNMNLVSGDYLTTGQDAYVVLRLDTDKYVMLGECGAMKVNAQGTEAAARTSIQLEAGSVLSEIQNPLGQDASYDIVTPNATMSVRGTVFEVRRNESENADEEGTISVLVYDGCVAVAPDGAESREYHAGEYTEFTDSAPVKFLTEQGTITEEQMNGQMLERLRTIEKSGRALNMDVITALASAEPETPSSEEEQTSASAETAVSGEEETGENATESSAEKSTEPSQAATTAPAKENPTKPSVTAPTESSEPESVPESTEAESEEDDSDDDPPKKKPSKPKPTEEPTESSSEEPSTEEPSSEEPSTEEPSSEEPVKKCRVAYYLPYIALWGDDWDGSKYSTIMDTEPINYVENNSIDSGSKLQKPTDVTVSMTPEGWIPEKSDLTHVGWCTIDGKVWNYDKDVVTEDTALYPVWKDKAGRKYYPYIHKTETKTYPCNSIIENSKPEVPKS